MADQLAAEMRRLCSVRGVKGTPAVPYAPPRYITGNLWQKIMVYRTTNGARVVVWAPYAVYLEKILNRKGFPHRFVGPALKNLGLTGRNYPPR